MGIKLKINTK